MRAQLTLTRPASSAVLLAAALAALVSDRAAVDAQPAATVDALAARIDPYVEKSRVIVMTDIANEPDDQMSMVRFLVYSNQFDVEGLIASTSTWMKNRVRPDVIETLVSAYDRLRPRLLTHQSGFPDTASLLQAQASKTAAQARATPTATRSATRGGSIPKPDPAFPVNPSPSEARCPPARDPENTGSFRGLTVIVLGTMRRNASGDR